MKWTIPNILSLYRLLMFPVLLWIIYLGKEDLFAILFVVSLITDILDGFIARRFNMGSEIGIMLDSWADFGVMILAVVGMVVFHPVIHETHAIWLWLFVGLYLTQLVIAKVKLGLWVAGWHAYSTKVAGYTQGIFFAVLFGIGFFPWLFKLAVILGIITQLELIALCFIVPEPTHNVKGVYWYLKRNKEQ
ncbi:CDP-alcohol phosphatidyltransferase family protein [Sanyastnella coralliicola]|uniref:CDP-alcohol phosphatidyltransferase family protein n=1 Tax=Sanyastnella coralliicola TaxID=3069118 RepID=UPI0027B8E065|nr:CDP-alcohol phosphatidyltransferase family protein [Longitalea sp. SCSIO 12813]